MVIISDVCGNMGYIPKFIIFFDWFVKFRWITILWIQNLFQQPSLRHKIILKVLLLYLFQIHSFSVHFYFNRASRSFRDVICMEDILTQKSAVPDKNKYLKEL